MAISPLTNERNILEQISQGNERAFTKLFFWYARPLAAFVQKLTGTSDLTEEIIQDVFVIIWQRRQTLQQIEHFHNYLFILCRNHTFAILKKMAAQRVHQLGIEHQQRLHAELETFDNPAAHYRELIDRIVEKLPEQQRQAYSLSRYQRLKHKEIALQMGISVETVKKHIQLSVQTIKKELGSHDMIVIILTASLALS